MLLRFMDRSHQTLHLYICIEYTEIFILSNLIILLLLKHRVIGKENGFWGRFIIWYGEFDNIFRRGSSLINESIFVIAFLSFLSLVQYCSIRVLLFLAQWLYRWSYIWGKIFGKNGIECRFSIYLLRIWYQIIHKNYHLESISFWVILLRKEDVE